ncbi:MAG: DUF2142 domain-containing protein [Verrucomicrobiota bacterium]|jgi:hypothetical protein
MTFPMRHERLIVGSLCLFAALHVFIFAAAFPFFTNVDERAHLGTVLNFARGKMPRTYDDFTSETVRCLALYNSKFYLGSETNRDELLPQPWKLPASEQAAWIAAQAPGYAGTNYENSQPPLYYAVAGACWNVTEHLGLDEGHRLYWLRFLNIPVVVLVVWLGWLGAKTVFTDSIFHRLAVPALLAFMPQSAFYSLGNPAFAPLFFGAAFVLLLHLAGSDPPSVWLSAAAGLALAGAFLVKMTNVPPLMVTVVFFAFWVWQLWRTGKLARSLPALSALCLCAALPSAIWCFWCRKVFGDFTGTRSMAHFWTWTPKPFAEWWSHPIFTFPGARKFFALFFSQFWQGEFTCHCQPMALRVPSWIYEFATAGLLAVALAKTLQPPALTSLPQRRVLWFGFFAFASSAAFLFFSSISYNFNQCPIPTPQIPYLTNGRHALGALIPFMLVFVSGLDQLMCRASLRTKFLALAVILLSMLGTEVVSDRRAFGDPYNWFHL